MVLTTTSIGCTFGPAVLSSSEKPPATSDSCHHGRQLRTVQSVFRQQRGSTAAYTGLPHAPSFDCEACNRTFGSDEALQQHIENSPAHAPSFNCEVCNRSFGSDEALQQHIRDSPLMPRRLTARLAVGRSVVKRLYSSTHGIPPLMSVV